MTTKGIFACGFALFFCGAAHAEMYRCKSLTFPGRIFETNVPCPGAIEINRTNHRGEWTKTGREDGGNSAAKAESKAHGGAGTFSYDINSHCREIGRVAGGSYQIEEACRNQEHQAQSKLSRKNIPSQIANHCREIGRVAGGSYSIAEACVEQETSAKSRLR
jgi:hypothetical protein